MASELDVLPTAASLAGLPYVNSTLGRDLLDPAFDAERYAFTVGDQGKVPQLGLIGKDRAFGVFGDGSNRRLTALTAATRARTSPRASRETAAQMEELCRALYETARYLPFVNAPEKVRGSGPLKKAHLPLLPVRRQPAPWTRSRIMIFCQMVRARPWVRFSTSFTASSVTGSLKCCVCSAASLLSSASISLQ